MLYMLAEGKSLVTWINCSVIWLVACHLQHVMGLKLVPSWAFAMWRELCIWLNYAPRATVDQIAS